MKTQTTSRMLDYLNSQLSSATGAHQEALGLVLESREYYDGRVDLDQLKGRSTAVMKDVMRAVEGAMPSLVDPFIGKDITRVDSQNAESADAAEMHQDLINKQWNMHSNQLETVEMLARNLMVDGTVWTKTGWNGSNTVEVVPFESVIPDPAAYKIDDMKFCIYRRKVTVSDILTNEEWFGKHTLSSLQQLSSSTDNRYEAGEAAGRDDSYDRGQRALDDIEIFEYYGEYDLEGSGVTTPIVAIWSNNTLLNSFDSPYPGFSIPFDNTVYVRRPYSLYGIGVGLVIGDKQTQRSALMRGILDNMNASNNAIKFVKKGALDATNFKRLMAQEPLVEVNFGKDIPMSNVMWDGTYNALPADVYKMLDDIETDEENMTGITKYAVGSDSRSLNSTATGVSIISSMSQRRLVFIAQHISGLLQRVFKKWMKMNAEAYPQLLGDFDLYVNAGTAGLTEKKNNDIISAMQALGQIPGGVPNEIIITLVSELADNMGLDRTAKALEAMRDTPPAQPDPAQDIAMQLEMEKIQAQIAKDRAITNRNNSMAQETMVDAAIKAAGGGR